MQTLGFSKAVLQFAQSARDEQQDRVLGLVHLVSDLFNSKTIYSREKYRFLLIWTQDVERLLKASKTFLPSRSLTWSAVAIGRDFPFKR